MKSSLRHRVQSSFIINAKIQIMIPHKTLNHVGDAQLGFVSPKETRPFNHHMAAEKNSATKSFCVAVLFFFVCFRVKRSQMQDVNPTEKGVYGEKKKKGRQMLIRDSQKFPCVWKKPSRTK